MFAKVLIAAVLAISFNGVESFMSPGSSLVAGRALGFGSRGRVQSTSLKMNCDKEPSMSRREVSAALMLALAVPTTSWAEEEKKPSRFFKVREELLKEAEEAEEHLKGKKDEGALKMTDLRQRMSKEAEEAEEEMMKESAEHPHMSMKALREKNEEYLKSFKHESEGVAMAVEVANNEHFADKFVEPFFIFSPFFFLWSGFKLFNRKWNLGQ